MAALNYQIDIDEGCADGIPAGLSFEQLPRNIRREYLAEARHYLQLPIDQWIDYTFYGYKLTTQGFEKI